MDTSTTSRSPTTVITANGEVQTHEEATVYVKELEIFLTTKVLEDHASSCIARKALRWTRIRIRVDLRSKTTSHKNRYSDTVQYGKLHTDRGSWFINEFFLKHTFGDIHDTFKAGNWSSKVFLKLVYLNTHFFVPCQKKVWIDKNGATRTGWITTPQSCQVNVWKGKNGETRTLLKLQKSCWLNQPKSKNQIEMRITSKYRETRVIPTYRNGCENSERILWMTEFLNAETHTQVLLMNYL